jgi:hypothetical protein
MIYHNNTMQSGGLTVELNTKKDVRLILEILERVSVADRNAHVVSLNRASLFPLCKFVVLFIRDSLPFTARELFLFSLP